MQTRQKQTLIVRTTTGTFVQVERRMFGGPGVQAQCSSGELLFDEAAKRFTTMTRKGPNPPKRVPFDPKSVEPHGFYGIEAQKLPLSYGAAL